MFKALLYWLHVFGSRDSVHNFYSQLSDIMLKKFYDVKVKITLTAYPIPCGLPPHACLNVLVCFSLFLYMINFLRGAVEFSW